jgi:peptidoglycan lytic transglycosylase D
MLQPMAMPEALSVPPAVADEGSSTAERGVEELDLACFQHPSIDAWEQRIRSERPLRRETADSVTRGARYLDRLRKIVTDAGLPPSVALLPVIESSFQPHARGVANCIGLWQLGPDTARRFGLRVNAEHDDRLDPVLATRAAARYLRMLHDRYNDWPLALAAYNAGEGRIDRALLGRPGAKLWDLADGHQVPRMSFDYVSRFLAVVRIVDDAPRACQAPGVTVASLRGDGR